MGVAAVAAVLVAGLAVLWLVHSGRVDAWLTKRLAVLLAPRVRFAAARVVWWPRLDVVLNDVAVMPRRAALRQDVAVTAASVTCRVRLAPLLSQRVEIAAVQVNQPRLTLERRADGQLYAGGINVLAAARSGRAGSRAAPTHLPAVRVRDGEIVLRSAEGETPPLRVQRVDASFIPAGRGARAELFGRLDDRADLRARAQTEALTPLTEMPFIAAVEGDGIDAASLLPWLPPSLAALDADGRLRFTAKLTGHGSAIKGQGSLELFDGSAGWAEWQASSPLRIGARASWSGDALSLSEGQLAAGRLESDALAADSVEAAFSYADGAVQVENAQLRALSGAWRGAGRVQLAAPASIEGSLTADDVDSAQLAGAVGALGGPAALPQFDAPLRLQATATGVPGGAWNGHAELASSGGGAWSNIRFDGPLQLAADLSVGAPVRGQLPLTLSNGQAQAGRVAVDRLSAEAVSAQFGYAGGALTLTPLRCTAFGGAWTYRGALPVVATTRWNGQLTATGIDAEAVRRALPTGAGAAASGRVDLTARLAGTGTNSMSATATTRLASDSLAWDAVIVEGPAEISSAVRLRGRRLTLTNGRARARAARVRTVQLSDIRSDFSYADDKLRLAALHARALDGRWHADGALALASTPSWSGTVGATHINVDALLRAVPHEQLGGPRSQHGIADLQLRVTPDHVEGFSGSADVRLASGMFTWDDLHVEGPAHASSAFAVRGGALSITHAAAEAARAAFGPLRATNATAKFDYAKDRLTFDDLRFQSCGGSWKHSGWFTLDEGGQFAGQLSIDGAVPSELQGMFGDAPGDIDFARLDLESEFGGVATAEWLQQLHASGAASMRDGTARSSVLGAIWQALMGSGRVTEAMNRLDRRTQIALIEATFDLRHEQFTTSSLSLSSDDYHATAVGTVGVDGALDLQARITLTSQGFQRMLILGSMPLPTSALPRFPPIPTDIGGTLDHPVILPNMAALPASTVRWLAQSVLHTPRTLGGMVVDRLRNLWHGTKRAAGAVRDLVRPGR